jgi:hypothetical protein
MLEQQGLYLGPWADAPARGGNGPTRPVCDLATRRPLGFVRQRGGGWAWLRWLGGQTLEVYEAQDESLLCTVQTPWWLARVGEIYDADQRRVAVVHGVRLLDGFGRFLAEFRPGRDGRGGVFVAADGGELGELTVAGPERTLRFGAPIADQPFAKMALLGAVLCQG